VVNVKTNLICSYDVDSLSNQLTKQDFLGRMELTLGELMGAPGSKIHRQLMFVRCNDSFISLNASVL
jgi:hypothetical protein